MNPMPYHVWILLFCLPILFLRQKIILEIVCGFIITVLFCSQTDCPCVALPGCKLIEI